jgi:hypothetical protein
VYHTINFKESPGDKNQGEYMKLLKIAVFIIFLVAVASPSVFVAGARSENPAQNETFKLTETQANSYMPVVTADYVVWMNSENARTIECRNVETKEIETLTSENSFSAKYFSSSWVGNQFACWSDRRDQMNGGDSYRQIYSCNLSAGSEFLVSHELAIDSVNAATWKNYAVFIQFFIGDTENISGIYLVDLNNPETQTLIQPSTNWTHTPSPTFYHGFVIWENEDGLNLYNIENKETIVVDENITNGNANPVITKNHLFYIDSIGNVCSYNFETAEKMIIQEKVEGEIFPLINNPNTDYLLFENWGFSGNKLLMYKPGNDVKQIIGDSDSAFKVQNGSCFGDRIVWIETNTDGQKIVSMDLSNDERVEIRNIEDEETTLNGVMIWNDSVVWYEKTKTEDGYRSDVFYSVVPNLSE